MKQQRQASTVVLSAKSQLEFYVTLNARNVAMSNNNQKKQCVW